MKTKIFHLQIIPIANILCHEEYDTSRAGPLVERLKSEAVLVNPIIVASLDNKKYLQLDGMNRLSAFKMMGYKNILAQVIDYNDQDAVELSSWCHLFPLHTENYVKCLSSMEEINVKRGQTENVGHRYIKEEGLGRICTVISSNLDVYLVSVNGKLLDKIAKLNAIVSCYKNCIIRDVLPSLPTQVGLPLLFKEHPEANTMVVFPTFTRHQIIKVVKKGGLFPAGVTRHLIKRRCLSVNVPMALFDNKRGVDDQNRLLEEFLSKKPYRVYEEPTVFFE
mgnify:CR=1 FL=1|jgi:hypothetical protein